MHGQTTLKHSVSHKSRTMDLLSQDAIPFPQPANNTQRARSHAQQSPRALSGLKTLCPSVHLSINHITAKAPGHYTNTESPACLS